jgi:hypothetical protein
MVAQLCRSDDDDNTNTRQRQKQKVDGAHSFAQKQVGENQTEQSLHGEQRYGIGDWHKPQADKKDAKRAGESY